jgi:hypothetical protein
MKQVVLAVSCRVLACYSLRPEDRGDIPQTPRLTFTGQHGIISQNIYTVKKGKVIPITGREGP